MPYRFHISKYTPSHLLQTKGRPFKATVGSLMTCVTHSRQQYQKLKASTNDSNTDISMKIHENSLEQSKIIY